MNSAVITKIEFRIFPDSDFSSFDIIPNSGQLGEQSQKDENGNAFFDCSVNFNIAKSDEQKDNQLKAVANRKAQFRVTDANGFTYMVGDTTYPARLSFTRRLDGTPGAFNGYRCVITCQSIDGCTIQP